MSRCREAFDTSHGATPPPRSRDRLTLYANGPPRRARLDLGRAKQGLSTRNCVPSLLQSSVPGRTQHRPTPGVIDSRSHHRATTGWLLLRLRLCGSLLHLLVAQRAV